MNRTMSPRVMLVLIAALFALPLAAAWLMYSGKVDYQPGSTRNLGQLVQPPVPAPLGALRVSGLSGNPVSDLAERWVIVRPLPAECDRACLDAAAELRQVHRASGRNQSRIGILLLLAQADNKAVLNELEAIYPLFTLATDPDGTFSDRLRQAAPGEQSAALAAGNTYLMDPLGNIMLFYEAGTDPNDLKKDLKRLLTWSKLDEQS